MKIDKSMVFCLLITFFVPYIIYANNEEGPRGDQYIYTDAMIQELENLELASPEKDLEQPTNNAIDPLLKEPRGDNWEYTPDVLKRLDELQSNTKDKDQFRDGFLTPTAVPPHTVPFYKNLYCIRYIQETDYYCGPAAVKSVLQNINGSSSSQSYYAGKLGTTSANGTYIGNIASVLNSHQSSYQYDYRQFWSQDEWLNRAQYTLSRNKPFIIDINSNSVSGWAYKTSGHYLVVSGLDMNNGGASTNNDFRKIEENLDSPVTPYRAINEKVEIVDPWWNGLSTRWYDFSLVYRVNFNHTLNAMVH